MQFIDEKFKDNDPVSTVEKIRGILKNIGVEVTEMWNESELENCYSLIVYANTGIPSANGKGISKDLARASAYGEFIERLQSGLFFYKYQSINRNPGMNIHTYAPDLKYMTVEELVKNSDWMDYYSGPDGAVLPRSSIAELCRCFSCSEDGRIPTVPYYSLFEDKYVWLPTDFVEQVYTSNGCCAGNTREEAWVHALSEIMERHCTLRVLTSGIAAPRIPDETLQKYPNVSKILNQLRENGEFEVDIFDYSIENGFPVISTRIISKKTHSYRVNVAADPVLEIAIQRTLTEMFQGSSVKNVTNKHAGRILNKASDISETTNVINQLENGTGLFTADFFANELTCTDKAKDFEDQSMKNNKELLQYMLNLYRSMGKQIYIRNLSYLGFPSYKVVVPGFSETRSIAHDISSFEYAIADESAKTLRHAAAASDDDLRWMLNHSNIISGRLGRYNHFNRLSGIPISVKYNHFQICITRAYASYRLHNYKDTEKYIDMSMRAKLPNEEDKSYLECVKKYIQLCSAGIDTQKVSSIIYKFFEKDSADRLYRNINNGCTPIDEFLVSCDFMQCETCKHRSVCSFTYVHAMNERIGKIYSTFINGQDRKEFDISMY